MNSHRFAKRLIAVLLAALLMVALVPFGRVGETLHADTAPDKEVASLSTSAIKAPSPWQVGVASWQGSYVWFGCYDGFPTLYRVLAPKTTKFGGTTMLVDSEYILFEDVFDNNFASGADWYKRNQWGYSSLKAHLNGSDFLTKSGGFTSRERDAIAESVVSAHALSQGTAAGKVDSETLRDFKNYVALTGEKIFVLDAEDISNSLYGYNYSCERLGIRRKTHGGVSDQWWLRSACPAGGSNASYVGYIDSDGWISYWDACNPTGVCPAFNIDLNSVIFTSLVSGTVGKDGAEYKLTVKDSGIQVALQKPVSNSGSTITLNYNVTGGNAFRCTQMSYLILDKPYTDGNSNNAQIRHYGKMDTTTASGSLNLPSTGTATFTLPAGYSLSGWNKNYYVYMLAEDVNGVHETDYASVPVQLGAPGAPAITTHPADTRTYAGTTAKFTVEATGTGTLTYQWQSRKSSASEWSNSGQSGAKTKTLSVATQGGLDGWQFRCIVKDANGRQAISDSATLSIYLVITQSPKNTEAIAGSTAKFTVAATGKGPITYQWQSRRGPSTDWSNSGQSGAKTATLTVNAIAGLNGWQFRCIVTDGKGWEKISDAATLSIVPIVIASQPANTTVAVGDTAKFTVVASGQGNLTYQWQSRKNSSASWSNSGQSGAKTATLSVAAIAGLHGWQFRCIIKDSKGNEKISNAATLSIKPKITTQPKNTTVAAGAKATFTVAATGKAPLTYQWQSRKNSSASWSNSGQSGAKTAKLTVNALAGLNGWQFRCIVTDANGQKTESNAATLSVN